MEKIILRYDESKWEEVPAKIVNTLQLFITNRCNLRCKACFYAHNLGKQDMTLEQYKNNVMEYKDKIKKVILLGGEPTLHPGMEEMIEFNRKLGLKTTIYTNGAQIKRLEFFDLSNVEIRVGVYGSQSSEKPLSKVPYVT
ncbi:MAG: radical SAM protein, partial [Nanoarchaeota archaeon]